MQRGRMNMNGELTYIANEAMLREKSYEEKDVHRTTDYAYKVG